MITVEKISECQLKVMGDASDEADIKQFFTFKAHGYQFTPRYKSGMWNGDISVFDSRSKVLPAGLFGRLESFCDESKIEFSIRENENYTLDDHDHVGVDELREFIDGLDLNLPSSGSVREYQFDAIHKAVCQKKITLVSPTSSGKSLILYCIIRWILDKNPHAKIVLMVPTIQLVTQMYSDFEDYSVHNGFDMSEYAQKLFTGQPKELTKNLLITTWQSLKNIADKPGVGIKILSEYTSVFADEAHTSKSTEVQSILEKCRNASYRIGTTGSMDNQKIHQLQIEGMLGPVYKVITTKELMDNGQVSNLDIRGISLVYPDDIKAAMKKTSYVDEIDFLVNLEKRNMFIAKIAAATTGTTLVLTKLREKHAKPLYDLISKISDKPVYFVAGTIKPAVREAIRKVANIEDCIIVATTQTMSTGVNIPNLRNVLFAMPSKDMITITQSIGRGLRLAEGKTKMTLIDIIDDIRKGKRENYAYQHAIERIALYRKEQFEMTVTEVPFSP